MPTRSFRTDPWRAGESSAFKWRDFSWGAGPPPSRDGPFSPAAPDHPCPPPWPQTCPWGWPSRPRRPPPTGGGPFLPQL
eukprot:11191341-Lingulodinium_polyedra.AAC.1